MAVLRLTSTRTCALTVIVMSLCALASSACAVQRPPRYVIESDVGDYRYRRYQKVLDIELPLPENPAIGHTATYVRASEPPEVVPVFITEYQRPEGLTESVRARLRELSDYALDVEKHGHEHVWCLRGERGDVWLLWVSGRQLVKIGAPEGAPRVPAPLAQAYLTHYPSDINRKGRAKRRADSAGPAVTAANARAGRSQ